MDIYKMSYLFNKVYLFLIEIFENTDALYCIASFNIYLDLNNPFDFM